MRRSDLLKITDEETADKILGMISGELDPCEVSERTDRWERQCFHRPTDPELILDAACDLLGIGEVQGWTRPSDYTRGISYCNTGDTYALTLALVDGEFRVTSYEALTKA
jgi:hypothetical protein